MKEKTAEEVLVFMIDRLLENLDDLYECVDTPETQYQYGQKVAYLDCLIMIQSWIDACQNGLDFDLTEKYKL